MKNLVEPGQIWGSFGVWGSQNLGCHPDSRSLKGVQVPPGEAVSWVLEALGNRAEFFLLPQIHLFLHCRDSPGANLGPVSLSYIWPLTQCLAHAFLPLSA